MAGEDHMGRRITASGQIDRRGRVPIPLPERIAKHARANPMTGCLEWTGALNSKGYGRMMVRGLGATSAHRIAYMLAKGPIPDGLEIDHLCRNRACCNPDHLEAVTHAENVRRGRRWPAHRTHCPQGHPYEGAKVYRRRRTGYGECCACNLARRRAALVLEKVGRARREKLTPEQAREIFTSAEPSATLALRFGVSQSAINHVRAGTTWRSITRALGAPSLGGGVG